MGEPMTDSIVKFPSWRDDLHLSDKKKPIGNLHNAITALRYESSLAGMLKFNQMARAAFISRPPDSMMPSEGYPHEIKDPDLTEIRHYLQEVVGMRTVPKETVAEAVDYVALDVCYHPLRDMLEALQWDGLPRLNTWMADCLGVEDNPYHTTVGRLFLIALVARIYQPGCKADYMVVLEGEQGKMKSLACEVLADPWFSDALPEDITSKEASQHLRGKWLIEVAEMHSFNKAEATHLKSFISRKTERYRPPYGRYEIDEPRQCLFIGTTNKELYLKDETGGRRFWPVKCISINLDRLKAIREYLLAEAVAAFKAGEQWWPDPTFEAEIIKPQQESRYDGDAWEEPIRRFLDGRLGTVSIMQIATGCLDYTEKSGPYTTNATPINRLGTHDQNRIKIVLRDIGWERLDKKTEKGVVFQKKGGTQV
jgi:predicted P-loop ATPase